METQKSQLLVALRNKDDNRSLAILREHPEFCDEEVIRLALDNSCLKTIRYLRRNDLITAAGKYERERQRWQDFMKQLEAFRELFPKKPSHQREIKEGSHDTREPNH